jgi:AhpD family alkylhydroperoxidase
LTQHYLQCDTDSVDAIVRDPENSHLSPKMKSLLSIAAAVQKGGKHVKAAHIERARKEGATDIEIHDTVLIAAAFCMFNRYVDGLGTWAPTDRTFYVGRAPARAEEGYANYDPYH